MIFCEKCIHQKGCGKRLNCNRYEGELDRPHGEWEYDDRSGQFICSECEGGVDMPTLMGEPLYKWCPWCGADMRKKEVDIDG